MSDARTVILQRIANALQTSSPATPQPVKDDWQRIPRTYEQVSPLTVEEVLALFRKRLQDYDAEVTLASRGDVSHTLDAILAGRGAKLTVVPTGFPEGWLPRQAPLLLDEGLSFRQLDGCDAVLTTATAGIAETGTLVLQARPGQGRRAATLIPDFHLCVVRANEVVGSVPEAFARLRATATLPTTFVSGPSATADIEMTRIKGVHGPRFLHVVLVTDDGSADAF